MNADPDDWLTNVTADEAADPPVVLDDGVRVSGAVWTLSPGLVDTLTREADSRANLYPEDHARPGDDE